MATQTAPVVAGSVSTRKALIMARISCSGRTMRSQYRQAALNASWVVVASELVCSTY